MEMHNVIEDIVIPRVEEIFNSIEGSANPENFCTCRQCRIDTACYVLNRTEPYYLVSNRGAARVQELLLDGQQKDTDITSLIYQGLRRVNHNQRPNFTHHSAAKNGAAAAGQPVFNIPIIVGRIFDGNNFSPVSGLKAELIQNGIPVEMKDGNWQNPVTLVSVMKGNFSFWPVPVAAEKADEHTTFEFTIRVEAENGDYEPLTHAIKIPVISDSQAYSSFTLDRTWKVPDLFIFPPEAEPQNRCLT